MSEMRIEPQRAWQMDWQQARLEERLADGRVQCHLSPRNCVIKEGRNGFCGVRGNRGGRLVTMNFGKSVHITQETIETEAVNHYSPGEPILSLGNIGCMFNCVYCHNWKTSQARHVSDGDIYRYTPEGVIEIAQRHGVRVISWTYNDPVVWHEFVLETSRHAKAAGMINLYKSALSITEEALDELLPVIDIFSVSIKSLDPVYYRRYTTGRLEPVLAACRQVHAAGKHLEVSTLMITDISDDEATAARVADWVLSDLDSRVPLHFVRFHPDYKLRNSIRTPIPRLIRAREIARHAGVEHVYLGNVYDTPYGNTYCSSCDQLLVERYGLNATMVGLDADANCLACGRHANIRLLPARDRPPLLSALPSNASLASRFDWHGDIRSTHVQALNRNDEAADLFVRRRPANGRESDWTVVPLGAGESYRFIIASAQPGEVGFDLAHSPGVTIDLMEVFDRAHFPTVSLRGDASPAGDVSPLPIYDGNQVSSPAVIAAQ
jgi:pyruvate formate lyase activating enzyme